MKIYMQVTQDEYELPIAIACTISELARKVGTDPCNIRSALCHARKSGKKSKYIVVVLEDEE